MGLFDEIRCEVPLPDGYDASDVWFQSKSFPDCGMCRYTITCAGRLIDSLGNDLEPEGYLNFYNNDRAADAAVTGGEPGWREYRARFVGGQLQRIERVDQDESADRYYGLASFRWFNSPSFLFGDHDKPAQNPEGGGE